MKKKMLEIPPTPSIPKKPMKPMQANWGNIDLMPPMKAGKQPVKKSGKCKKSK